MEPLVSVVIPSYNRRSQLLRLLGTLESQTLPPEQFEVIVVLDGSNDDSATAISSRPWPFQLHVVRQGNAGPGAARNAGAAKAIGPKVAFIDDDIQLEPAALSEHVRVLDDHPGAIAIGRVECQWTNHGMGQRGEGYWSRFDAMADGASLTFRECYGCNLSMESAMFRNLGGFCAPMRRLEDVEFGFRAEQSGIALVYARNAAGIHDVMKTPAGALRDAYHSGSATTFAWRDRPAFLVALGQGFRKPQGDLAARAITAAISIPFPFQLATWLGNRPAAHGVRHLHSMLWYRWYLRGARATATNAEEFRAFLGRRN